MKQCGFSLIECVFAIGIFATGCGFAVAGTRSFTYKHNARSTLQQLQQAIVLARSIAITHNCHVHVYLKPTGLDINTAKQKFKKHINLNIGTFDELSLQQSGFNNKLLTIKADGMTYTNGHFNYKSRNGNALPQFNLYFNRALRTYVLISG